MSVLCFLALTGIICLHVTKFGYVRGKKGGFSFLAYLNFYLQHLLVQEYSLYDLKSIPVLVTR